MVVTVVSVDGSPYLSWQTDLLRHSHRRVRQPGELVVLSDVAHVPGDSYPPYNKPYALHKWLEANDPPSETVLVVDPDMVFVRPEHRSARPGRPVATESQYQVTELLEVILKSHAADPSLLQPISVPLLIHRDDLRALAPLWFSYTIRLRADPLTRALISWICEMWACSLAALDLGLVFELERGAVLPPAGRLLDAPFIHYSWPFEGFDKRTYRPWEPLPPGGSEIRGYLHDLIDERRKAHDRSGGAASDLVWRTSRA